MVDELSSEISFSDVFVKIKYIMTLVTTSFLNFKVNVFLAFRHYGVISYSAHFVFVNVSETRNNIMSRTYDMIVWFVPKPSGVSIYTSKCYEQCS